MGVKRELTQKLNREAVKRYVVKSSPMTLECEFCCANSITQIPVLVPTSMACWTSEFLVMI